MVSKSLFTARKVPDAVHKAVNQKENLWQNNPIVRLEPDLLAHAAPEMVAYKVSPK